MEKEVKLKDKCEMCRQSLINGLCVNVLCKMGNEPYNTRIQEVGKYVFFNR